MAVTRSLGHSPITLMASDSELTGDSDVSVSVIDAFCGVGGLSYGLMSAGVDVVAGIDVDGSCRYPFETNIPGAEFIERDIGEVKPEDLTQLWPSGSLRLLAGCAPCQPFSSYHKGSRASEDSRWGLLQQFARLVEKTKPEFVTTENVPRIRNSSVFRDFVSLLEQLEYKVDVGVCACVDFGLAQTRRRLVLVASRLGPIKVPEGLWRDKPPRTVKDAIEHLPEIAAGETHPDDPLHRSRRLSPLNLKRIEASQPGGTWHDWPEKLRAPCHRRATGASFKSVYARMEWERPGPTITTYFHNFGTGRFGHPEQNRALSLREAAILQGFPDDYVFVPVGGSVPLTVLGQQIGNAVPPPLGAALGDTFLDCAREAKETHA